MTRAEAIRIAWALAIAAGVMLAACGAVGVVAALLERGARRR